MSEEKKTPVIIDEKEYFLEEMNEQEKHMLRQINELNTKIRNTELEHEQYAVAKSAFINILKNNLEKD